MLSTSLFLLTFDDPDLVNCIHLEHRFTDRMTWIAKFSVCLVDHVQSLSSFTRFNQCLYVGEIHEMTEHVCSTCGYFFGEIQLIYHSIQELLKKVRLIFLRPILLLPQ